MQVRWKGSHREQAMTAVDWWIFPILSCAEAASASQNVLHRLVREIVPFQGVTAIQNPPHKGSCIPRWALLATREQGNIGIPVVDRGVTLTWHWVEYSARWQIAPGTWWTWLVLHHCYSWQLVDPWFSGLRYPQLPRCFHSWLEGKRLLQPLQCYQEKLWGVSLLQWADFSSSLFDWGRLLHSAN